MKTKFLALLLILLPSLCRAETTPEFKKLSDATLILYKQSAFGSMNMACSATVFQKVDLQTYKVLTAAHCVVDTDEGMFATKSATKLTKKPIFLSLEDSTSNDFIRATVDKVGKTDNGFDFCVLTISTDRALGVVPLGDEKLEQDGAPVLNLAVPSGLGKTCFRGWIARTVIDRPLIEEDSHIDWAGGLLLQLPISGGSSGSAIMSVAQQKIIGVVVGVVQGHAVALPISRLANTDKDNWLEIKK